MKNKLFGYEISRLSWGYWLIIILSMLLTFFAWLLSNSMVQEKLEQRFNFQSDQLIGLVTERMSRYEDALRSGVAAMSVQSNGMNASEWKVFANSLDIQSTYQGVSGIGVIFNVMSKDKDTFIKEQKYTRPYYKIYPQSNQSEFWPIAYIEPEELNSEALGLDMAFEKNRLSAAEKSRDTATTQITAPIILVQDAKKTPGFLQFVPIYSKSNLLTEEDRRKYFVGHVFAPFIMSRLIKGTIEQKNRKLNFSIYDGEHVLFDELQPNYEDYDPTPLFYKKIRVDMYGRIWEFTIHTGNAFRSSANINESIIILISGIIFNLFLFIFFILSISNKKSTGLANAMKSQLAISEQYYRNILESAPCGIIIVNKDGVIERVNPQVEDLFGYTMSDLLNMSIEELVPKEYRKSHPGFREQYWNSPSKRTMGDGANIYGLRKSGQEFPVEIGLAQFSVENSLKVIATIVDMSVHTKIVDEIKRSNKELDDFAYVASHDLKAPLRGIVQLSNWVGEDIENIATDETKKNLDLLKNRTIRLEKLLDDLLSYSRIGRHTGDELELDINELVTNIFNLLNPPDSISLVVNGVLPTFKTMVVPIDVIFRNLIGNAIKHNDKDLSVIEISCSENHNFYEFTVEDDGPGILPKHHLQIFELFKTLKPRDEVEGSGMGLSIIMKTVTYYGGNIKVDSDGKKGTKFIFNWPKNIEN